MKQLILKVIILLSGLVIGALTMEHTLKYECNETNTFRARFLDFNIACEISK